MSMGSELEGGESRLGTSSLVPRFVVGVALAILSGTLLVLAAPQHGFGWLILVAGVPMLVAQYHVLPARLAGVATATTYGIAAWGTFAVLAGDAVDPLVVQGGVVLLALAAGVFGRVQRLLWDTIGYRWWIAAAPLSWGVLAMIRLRMPSAGTDGFMIHSLFRHPAVLQPVSVVGVIGLEMGLVLIHVVLAALVMSALGHPAFPHTRAKRLGIGLAAGVTVWVSWSALLLSDPRANIRVAAIQPNLFASSQISVGSVEDQDPFLAPYAKLTRQAAEQDAQLVVWPEYGLSYDPCTADASSEAIVELAESTSTFIVVGYGVTDMPDLDATGESPLPGDLDGLRHRNEAVLITPEGECLGPYAKQHPVKLIDERSDTDYGTPVFDTELGRLAMVICYDFEFTDVSRALASRGAQLIAAPSEDWEELAEYHAAPLVFRSIENGVATVKADMAYDSAIIDPHGRIVAETIDPKGATEVVVADVPLGTGRRTIWNRFAPAIEVALLTTALAVATAVVRDIVHHVKATNKSRTSR
jgi:apolipoprotein N-acyltransferase